MKQVNLGKLAEQNGIRLSVQEQKMVELFIEKMMLYFPSKEECDTANSSKDLSSSKQMRTDTVEENTKCKSEGYQVIKI